MRRTTLVLTMAAICAAVGITAPAATGKTFRYEGPVNQPFLPSPAGFSTSPPTMQLKVTFAGKTPKVIPGGTLKADGLYGSCAFGAFGCAAYPGEPPQCKWFQTDAGDQLKISKKRRFAGTFQDQALTRHPRSGEDFFTVTGRVSKRSIAGTVRAYGYQPATSEHPAATCDTGVLTWSASK